MGYRSENNSVIRSHLGVVPYFRCRGYAKQELVHVQRIDVSLKRIAEISRDCRTTRQVNRVTHTCTHLLTVRLRFSQVKLGEGSRETFSR